MALAHPALFPLALLLAPFLRGQGAPPLPPSPQSHNLLNRAHHRSRVILSSRPSYRDNLFTHRLGVWIYPQLHLRWPDWYLQQRVPVQLHFRQISSNPMHFRYYGPRDLPSARF
ncbi:hypothetical protein N7471_010391 [Penicillium samsonianum]|uniref:uncharacterized protein n=1 Tax=Penicillium samsonianum TaxID=1882272 RepID=UPI0025498710|nr:uncharacterized protein N7471_010362 [Penicillium samsonianum]XP_057132089.1 uncharacterized protein N7471_010391 [Penicillium samsonianum]KAJ6125869.1 hypothetical protein N7471_010362 [Penicillium samsonianum]KAJ6125898.1 hypothetical protein N7471_010391 [Penicillium samsonianum]